MTNVFYSYFEHMNDLAVCRDQDRRIIAVNQAFTRIFGGKLEDWAGRSFDGAVSGAQIGAFDDSRAYGQVLANGRTYWLEWDEARLPEGGSITVGRLNSDRRSLGRSAPSPERDRRRNKSSICAPLHKAPSKTKPSPPPAALEAPKPNHTLVAPTQKPSDWRAPVTTVLLVEDDPLSAKLAMALLGNEDCEVTHVCDGSEALEQARNRTFDLVFMDMRMPKMNGPSACRAIRALGGAWKDIPIVALTANAFEEDRKACHAAGMTGFVTKPINVQTFMAVRKRWTLDEKQAKLA